MPKAVVETLNEIPEALKAEYEPKDGKFVLKVEGAHPDFVPIVEARSNRDKVIELRDNNIKLMRALGVDSVDAGVERANIYRDFTPDRLKALKDVDPDEYRTLKAKSAAFDTAGVKDPNDVLKLVENAVKTAMDPMRAELETQKKENTEKQKRLDETTFRTKISDAAHKVSVKPSAIDFLLQKAGDFFHVKDSELKAKPDKFSASKPGEPLSVEEWLAQATKEFDFAFEKSGGSGAAPTQGGLKGRILVDPTPQDLAKHMDDITAGKIKVQHSS